MTAIAAGEGGFQETLVRVGHAMHVIEQGRQDFVQIPLRILGHRDPILGAFGIEALGLHWRQADRLDAPTYSINAFMFQPWSLAQLAKPWRSEWLL